LRSALGSSDYLKVCEQAVKDLGTAYTKAKAGNPQMATPDSNGDTQWGAAQDVADLSKAGAQTQAQRKAIAQQAARDFYQVALSVDNKLKKMAKEDVPRIKSLPAATFNRVNPLAEKSVDELGKIRNQAINLQGQSQQAAANFQASETQLTDASLKSQRVANQLDGGQSSSSGVSSGTWVALGGAALIAAGTVGGIAYFGNKGLDKMDKIADQKIDKFEDTAKDIIKEAEDSAKRIIEFASNKASKVLADAEKTVTNIIDQAKKDGEALIQKISKEIEEQFENLSDTGLEKLRTEMSNVFAEAIAKAKNAGDAALEETLTKARDKTMEKIQGEIDRRAAALPKSSVPNTNTATSTSTSTSSTTESTSSTATSSSTSTATGTSSNSVTTTSTTTSTDIRE
jgi:F0F1-type ATP synthase membrane subunit b/b'